MFIRVRLEFEMTGGAAIYRGILTGSIDDDPEPCHVFEFILSSTSDPEIAGEPPCNLPILCLIITRIIARADHL